MSNFLPWAAFGLTFGIPISMLVLALFKVAEGMQAMADAYREQLCDACLDEAHARGEHAEL